MDDLNLEPPVVHGDEDGDHGLLNEEEEPPEPEGHALSDEVAKALGSKEFFRGPLPFDIAAIWGHPPMRVSDEATCRVLIGAWGVEAFRGSQLHRTALAGAAREAHIEEPRSRFKAEREAAKRRGGR